MIKEEVEKLIQQTLGELKLEGSESPLRVELEHPENTEHGDFSTNIALQVAKSMQKSPQAISQEIVSLLGKQNSPFVERAEALNGFVNVYLKEDVLVEALRETSKQKESFGNNSSQKGKKIMVEYAHPNTHKELHIGHMRTLVTGEALARIFSACGAKVFRANYQGDIGPHVAKAIWGTEQILQERGMSWEKAEKLGLAEKAHLLGQGYVKGNQEYESSKDEIDELNTKLYGKDKEVTPVYLRTRKWSLDYYDSFYNRFGTKFNKLYFESEVAEAGKKIVEENMGKVFEESDGAVIFDGEKHGLHKRVFLTQDKNPTYEAKEMGLAPVQYKDFAFDLNVHVVANEQSGYFDVVLKALELVDEKFRGREYHLPMGMVQLVGEKISSRTGVIVTVDDVLNETTKLLSELITTEGFSEKEIEEIKEVGTIAAVKYSVLKTGAKSNVLFDLESSVALDGNSGPYLLYTYARCRSIIRKADIKVNKSMLLRSSEVLSGLSKEELDILRLAYRFPEVVQEAAEKYAPNLICSFVFDLAQKYNTFYHTHPVLSADTVEQKEFRLLLTSVVAQLISNSFSLLGIKTLEKM